jgi:hypothetical protein
MPIGVPIAMPDADRSIRVVVNKSVERIIGWTDMPGAVPNPMMAPVRLCGDWDDRRQGDGGRDQYPDKRSDEFSHDAPRMCRRRSGGIIVTGFADAKLGLRKAHFLSGIDCRGKIPLPGRMARSRRARRLRKKSFFASVQSGTKTACRLHLIWSGPAFRCIAAIARIAWPGSSLFVASEKLSDFKFVEIKFERIASRI